MKKSPLASAGSFFLRRLVKPFLITLTALVFAAVAGGIVWLLSPPPVVLGSNEITIEKNLSFNAPFRISFSTKMHRQSAENAFSVSPDVNGKFSWENDQEMLFVPDQNLEIGKIYTVSISTEAKSWLGKKMEMRFTQEFLIIGPPQVVFITPIESAEWAQVSGKTTPAEATPPKDDEKPALPILKKDQRITVMFDRPMRSAFTPEEDLQDTEAQKHDLKNYLQITPQIAGEFNWLGTSTFEFLPAADTLPMGQEFEVKLLKDFPSADGGRTENELVWHFETAAPEVVATVPAADEEFVDPAGKVRITWNQEVDLESLFAHLTVSPDLPKEIKRTMDITADKDDKKTTIIAFEPSFPKDEIVEIKITAGVKSLQGTKESTAEFALRFTTLADPAIREFTPAAKGQIFPDESLKIVFSTPADPAEIAKNLVFEPKIEEKDITVSRDYDSEYMERNNRNIVSGEVPKAEERKTRIYYSISAPFPADTAIKWTLKDGLKDEKGQILAKGFTGEFSTKSYRPQMQLMSRGGQRSLFDSDEPVSIFVRSRNVQKANFEICRLSEAQIANIENYTSWWNELSCAQNPERYTWTENLAYKKNEWVITEVSLSERAGIENGIWFYRFSSPEYLNNWDKKPVEFYEGIFLANAALTAKISDTKVIFWATDFLKGEPVAGMKIRIFGAKKDRVEEITVGETNEKGVFEFPKAESYMSFFAVGEKANLKAYVGISWTDGIAPWDFGIPQDWQASPHNLGFLFTDRPIFRPGDTVNFKGIIRTDTDATLSIPVNRKLQIQIESPTGKVLLDKQIELSDNGAFADSLKLEKSAETGQYLLIAKSLGKDGEETYDWFSRVFWVEEYRKPDFKITLTAAKEFFINKKDEFAGELSAERYFGAAMPGMKVSWHAIEEPYYFDKITDEWFNFSPFEQWCWWECDSAQKVVAEGEGETDANGKLKISFPLTIEEKSPRLLTVRTTIVDETGRAVSNAETFEVYPDSTLVGIRAEDYFLSAASDKARFKIATITPAGEKAPEQKVKITLYRVDWQSVQKQGIDGAYYWEGDEKLEELDQKEITTDMEGRGTVAFDIKAEEKYRGQIRAVATLGEAEASANSYISSGYYVSWRRENNDRIAIVTDKKSYKIGETAKLIVQSPFKEPVKALVTIERKEILDLFLTDIESGKALEIPVKENMLPNAYVSVVLIKGKGVESTVAKKLKKTKETAEKIATLADELKSLEEKINGFETELKNYETATDITNLESRRSVVETALTKAKNDLNGKKIEKSTLEAEKAAADAEIKSLGMPATATTDSTETATPKMKMGLAEISVEIDAKRLDLKIETNKESYLPGEEVEISLQAAPDTEITVAVVDESVLALKSRNLEDVVNFFWGRRQLGITTVQTLVYFTERLNVQAQKGQKGGGGGAETALELSRKKRGEFRDTAHWLPTVITDGEGRAKVKFTLPDNLTTWQIFAIGANKKSQFGMATKNFLAKKNLMVTPALPRFAVDGDTFKAAALVHNQSTKEQTVEVSLKAQNFEMASLGNKTTLTLKPGGQELVAFEGKVKSQADKSGQFASAVFTFRAENALYLDEVELAIPVNPPAIGESIATSGQVNDLATEKVRIPDAALAGIGNLALTLSALKTGNITDGLNDLINYPYGCAEQTMSAHLPNVIAKQVEKTLGTQFISVSDETLQNYVDEALQKFYKFQTQDGGFGFWEGANESYPELSAYILFGLLETKKAGYSVDQTVIDRAISYLRDALYLQNDNRWTASDKAFALFILSEFEKNADLLAAGNNLFDGREKNTLFGKISLLIAFQNFRAENLAGASDKAATLLKEIEAEGKQTARGVQFEEKAEPDYYWALSSDIRTTALALLALSRENVDHPLIPKIVDYLQAAKNRTRYGGPWGTTQNTAWVLVAYLEWLEKSDQLKPNFTATVHLNNQPFAEKSWKTDTRLDTETFIKTLAEINKSPLDNELNFKKDGEGKLFYDLIANYYLPVDKITEKTRGLGVVREFYAFDDKEMKQPLLEARKGDLVRGKITIMVPETRHFVVVDSPLPAGLEAVNFALETEDQSLLEEVVDTRGHWWWWDDLWYFNHKEIRDDRIALFADYLPAGKYEYKFLARATAEGSFQLVPAVAEEMYHPETFGRTAGFWFTVKP